MRSINRLTSLEWLPVLCVSLVWRLSATSDNFRVIICGFSPEVCSEGLPVDDLSVTALLRVTADGSIHNAQTLYTYTCLINFITNHYSLLHTY